MVDVTKFTVVDTGHTTRNNIKKNCPFDFIGGGHQTCVITLGDSWTWGCDMTVNDHESTRLSNHYGRVIANSIGADWCNIAQGGSGNFWIYDRVRELANMIPELHYNKIYVICTFTETGRAIEARQDIDFYSWFKNNNIDKFVPWLNNLCVEKILASLQHFQNVKSFIGTNFVDWSGYSYHNLLSKSWLQCLCEHYGIDYNHNCQIVSSWVMEGFRTLSNLTQDPNAYLDMINTWVDIAIKRANLLRTIPDMKLTVNPSTNRVNTGHPGVLGHKLWAEYILRNL